jgi:predicted outer membrane protein
MLLKKIAIVSIPLFLSATALAGSQSPDQQSQEQAGQEQSSEVNAQLSRSLSALHALAQNSIEVSELAAENASSELVKQYASSIVSGNKALDEKLREIAAENSVEIVALDPQTEIGKSLKERIEAEKMMLSTLKGDAFDKEYMVLVTNAQQSVIKFAEVRIKTAKNERVKEFFTNLKTLVGSRNEVAQGILEKLYGDDL